MVFVHTRLFSVPLRWCIVAAFVLSTVPAIANDATFGGQGADLVLLTEGRIRMVSEDIRLVENWGGSSEWTVYAHYVFENPTGDSVSVRMGFPEMAHCESGDVEFGPDVLDPRFRNLVTLVRGEPVELSTGMVKKSEWDFCLGMVYLFDVTFAPHERLEIDHSYEYSGTVTSLGSRVNYLTRTGSLWNGTIGRAEFTVAMVGLQSSVFWPSEYRLVEHYRDRFPTDPYGTVRTVYRFRQENWLPGRNFEFSSEQDWWDESLPECCPQRDEFEEIFSGPDVEGKLTEIVECLALDSFRICRNNVYARYGRPFSDTSLSHYFYTNPGPLTTGGYSEEDGIFTVGYQINPRYSDDLLTKEEKEFVYLLRKIEEERRGATGTTGE